MRTFTEYAAGEDLIRGLKGLLDTNAELSGIVRNGGIQVLSQGQKGGVIAGQADQLRDADCDYTFHTHPSETDVPYPSGNDIIAAYMTGKTDLVVTRKGIHAVRPMRLIPWQEVQRINNELWQAAQVATDRYQTWKDSVQKTFPVQISTIPLPVDQ